MRHPEYKTDRDRLYIRGFCEEDDLKPFIIPNEKVELVKDKINAINEKYGKPKRWRAEYNERYYYFNSQLKIDSMMNENDTIDNQLYELGNYFKTEEEAQEYENKLKKILSERE